MHRKKMQMAMFAMAILISVSSPVSVLADTISNSGQELEQEFEQDIVEEETVEGEITFEEEILSGTQDIQESLEEEIVTGTENQDENQVLRGIADIAETATIDIKKALDEAEIYLQKHVTSPSVSTTAGEWSVLAMARGGYLTDSTKTAYLTTLYQILQENQGVLHKVKYTEYSRVVIALSALNINPESVNGYNLLEPLADFKKVSGQGINGSIYALIALDTKKYEIPEGVNGEIQTTRDALIADILGKEIAGGGWALAGNYANPDITAAVIQCLTPYTSRSDVNAAVNRGIEKLAAMQEADGGYADQESGKNLESTAQVVIALSGLDVNLLYQEKFMKNGKTLLDEVLRFQKDDGSFCHIAGGGSDAIATDHGTLALLAWQRAVNGQTRLYDMTDQGGAPGQTQETQEKVDAFRKKIEELPKQITIADKDKIYSLKTELDSMNAFEEKEEFRIVLNTYAEEIAKQEEDVKNLDERIWKEINPLKITLKDQKTIESLLADFEKIPEANREYLKRTEELKKAEIIIGKLQKKVLAEEIFQTAKEARKDYLHEEEGYTIRIKGKKIHIPADMKTSVEIQEKDGSLHINMAEKGELPGEIELSVLCTLKDGVYMLYNDKNQEEQWVGVDGNMVSFDLSKGGNYILKKADMGYEDREKPLGGSHNATGSVSAGTNTSKRPAASNTTKTMKKTATSNTSEAKVQNGVVDKKEFETIKEKDKNMKINGKTNQGKEYTLTINGKDVKNVKDMKIGVNEGSKYQGDMKKLADKPYIFSFEEHGDFPGKMQMEMVTDQEDGHYLLMKYNEKERKAELIQKVKVENKKTKFIVDKGGDYFIAKKVKTKSLDELEAQEKELLKQTKDSKKKIEPVEEEILTGTKEESSIPTVLFAGGGILVLASLGACVWYFRKRK